jgi:hypothetical protein
MYAIYREFTYPETKKPARIFITYAVWNEDRRIWVDVEWLTISTIRVFHNQQAFKELQAQFPEYTLHQINLDA